VRVALHDRQTREEDGIEEGGGILADAAADTWRSTLSAAITGA